MLLLYSVFFYIFCKQSLLILCRQNNIKRYMDQTQKMFIILILYREIHFTIIFYLGIQLGIGLITQLINAKVFQQSCRNSLRMKVPFQSLAIILLCLRLINPQTTYELNMTSDQFSIYISTVKYMEQHKGKTCSKASLYAQHKFCTKRCQFLYYYVPSAPYKNYRNYNKTTKQCQPRPICPDIYTVRYTNSMTQCEDITNGAIVQGIDAKPTQNKTYPIKFICENGYIGTHLGLTDCICHFGYKTEYVWKGLDSDNSQRKCNKAMTIYEFISTAFQIYYDPALQNPFPHASDQYYWGHALVYYLKQMKRQLSLLIWPHQVQMTMLFFDRDPIVYDDQIVILIWIGILLGFILMITCYQSKNVRTRDEIIAEQQMEE